VSRRKPSKQKAGPGGFLLWGLHRTMGISRRPKKSLVKTALGNPAKATRRKNWYQSVTHSPVTERTAGRLTKRGGKKARLRDRLMHPQHPGGRYDHILGECSAGGDKLISTVKKGGGYDRVTLKLKL